MATTLGVACPHCAQPIVVTVDMPDAPVVASVVPNAGEMPQIEEVS